MDHHKHIINTLGARYGMVQIALGVGNKKKADEIFKEMEKWFKTTYKVSRIKTEKKQNV